MSDKIFKIPISLYVINTTAYISCNQKDIRNSSLVSQVLTIELLNTSINQIYANQVQRVTKNKCLNEGTSLVWPCVEYTKTRRKHILTGIGS